MKYLKGAKFAGKTVLLRADFNIETEDGKVRDDYRIIKTLPTIERLIKDKCKIIIVSHRGRPDGKPDEKYTLRPAGQRLAELLKRKFVESNSRLPEYTAAKHVIFFTGDISSGESRDTVKQMSAGDIVLLENIRFYEGEEKNSAVFARSLASLADVYINDAFAVSHRKAASVVAITQYLPSYCGVQLEKEVLSLQKLLQGPKSPFVAIMGGIKISDKVETIENLAKRADHILLGGGLANMIFLSRGFEVGQSKVESEAKATAFRLDHSLKGKLHLPVDVVVAKKDLDKKSIRVCAPFQVKSDELILDLGPKTILQFAKIIKSAKTVVWNGPLGYFEHKPFHHATMSLAKIVGAVGKGRCFAVTGGGETVDAIRKSGQEQHVDHVSTGGGAMLELLAGRELPGIKALENNG